MSDDTIEAKIDKTTDTGTTDRAESHADRPDNERQELGESVRDAIKSAWREETGREPDDSNRDEERERRLQERRAEPKGRAVRAAKESAAAEAESDQRRRRY
jgi:hypothetical protein